MTEHNAHVDIDFEVLGDDDATCAWVQVTIAGAGAPVRIEASASAKRHPKDDYDRTTGETLALARALERVAGQLHAAANRRIQPIPSLRSVLDQIMRQQALAEKRRESQEKFRNYAPKPIIGLDPAGHVHFPRPRDGFTP